MGHNLINGIVNDLPIEKMVAAPLLASIKAQSEMSMALARFVSSVGLDSTGNVRMVTFSYEDTSVEPAKLPEVTTPPAPGDKNALLKFNEVVKEYGYEYQSSDGKYKKGDAEAIDATAVIEAINSLPVGDKITSTKRNIQAPFLALTGIPNLAVEQVNVEFELEVKTAEDDKSTSNNKVDSETGVSLKSWWSPVNANTKLTASVTHASEQTRHTDTRAKYQFNVTARKQPAPEAFMRIIDAITNSVTNPTSKSVKNNLISEAEPAA